MKWIIKYWAIFGVLMSVFILCVLTVSNLVFTDTTFLLWLHFALLLIHQFEEYVYPGGFKDFFNQHIYKKNRITTSRLNNHGILFVNIVLAWTSFIISAIYNVELLWLAIGLLLVTLFNGLLHTILFIIKKAYNPGLISGLFLFIPFAIFALLQLKSITISETWRLGIATFIIGTALIPVSIALTHKIKN